MPYLDEFVHRVLRRLLIQNGDARLLIKQAEARNGYVQAAAQIVIRQFHGEQGQHHLRVMILSAANTLLPHASLSSEKHSSKQQ